MEALETISRVTSVQNALHVISLLQLTSYRYPQQSTVVGGIEFKKRSASETRKPELKTGGARFDYIVIGAGSAGSVVANRLTEDLNTTVLLVEAGGDPPLESNLPGLFTHTLRSHVDWNYTSSGPLFTHQCHQNSQLLLNRGKMLGGSSSMNGLFYVRGDPRDYDQWAASVNDETWNYKNVLPYFIKSERLENSEVLNSPTGTFHGTNGLLGVTTLKHSESENYYSAFKELGYNIVLDINGNITLGVTEPQITLANNIRQSTANSFLSTAKDRPNLYVLKNNLAAKINFIDKTATSVDVIDIDKRKTDTFIANREIIVSAGATNSPQLLMLSGIGPKKHLQNLGIEVRADLPVGENLQDHLMVSMLHALDNSKPLSHTPNPHEHPLSTIIGFVALNESQTYPDFQITSFHMISDEMLQICLLLFFYNEDICQSYYDRSKGRDISYTLIDNSNPKSRGRILLKNLDPKEYPSIFTESYSNETDLENVVKYLKDIFRLTYSSFFQKAGSKFLEIEKCADLGISSDEYWRCHARCMATTMWHYSGTCAMGTVVDSRLRVRGVRGLRVVDASVMPTITSGNTNAPAMMIGEKAADMIKEDRRNCG